MMVHWKNTLDVSDVWKKARDREISPSELSGIVATRLKPIIRKCVGRSEQDGVVWELETLVWEFEDMGKDPTTDFEDFDEVWERLYDWADEDHRLWIKLVA